MTGDHPLERALGGLTRALVTLTLLALPLAHLLGADARFLGGLAVGGGLGVLNLLAMTWLGRRLVRAEARSRTFYAVLFGVKLTVLLAVIVALLYLAPIDPVGFVVGITLLVPAVGLVTLWVALAPREPLTGRGPSP